LSLLFEAYYTGKVVKFDLSVINATDDTVRYLYNELVLNKRLEQVNSKERRQLIRENTGNILFYGAAITRDFMPK